MTTYTVRFELEIEAATPKQAVTIMRDILLNPDSQVHADVFPMEYVEAAEDWFHTEKYGWYAWFEGDVHPRDFIEWYQAET